MIDRSTKAYVISGSREHSDYQYVKDRLLDHVESHSLIITGDCRGVDYVTQKFVSNLSGISVIVPADWSHGKAGGPIRNFWMLDLAKTLSDEPELIAFPMENSVGTLDCITQADKMKIPYTVYKVEG